jgi:hypothetical protein
MPTNTLSYPSLHRRRLLLRCWYPIIFGVLLFIAVSASCAADVGARPLAMGGAFVGLADDANATYYNPAGIARLDSSQMTFSYDANDPYGLFSRSYLSYVSKVPGKNIGYGVSYASNRFVIGVYDRYEEGNHDSYWLSGACKVFDTYVGMNVRYTGDSIPGVRTGVGIDLSLLKVLNEKWSAGLLFQDMNNPKLCFGGGQGNIFGDISFAIPTNVRPGIAYRFDKNTVVTMDLYGVFGPYGRHSTRLGAEKVLKNGTALRAGFYGLPSGSGLITLGVGGKVGKMQLDGAYMTHDSESFVLLGATGKF